MVRNQFIMKIKAFGASFWVFLKRLWYRYRLLPVRTQWILGVVAIVILVFGGYKLTHLGSSEIEQTALPTVTVASVSALSGSGTSVTVIGSVRSVTEADILAQSGGTVTSVNASVGDVVPAGFVIAELDNASQRAAVLQAEGAYEAAKASQSAASVSDIAASARNTYATAYSSLDTLLKSDIDTFFGDEGGQGPAFLIGPSPFDVSYFPVKREALTLSMNDWRMHLGSAATADPQVLLDEADRILQQATALGNDLSLTANRPGTDATAAQLTALAAARSGVSTLQAQVTAAKTSYQGQNTSATAGASASVKIALGGLEAAEAQLEKTLVRAPVSGTINFLPIREGDYASPMTRVATVAQNGALEIVTYLSEDTRALISVGTKVTVEDSYPAVITSIAPALDPVTKQIEVHLSLNGTSSLVNGQSVRVSIPNALAQVTSTKEPLLLPLTSLKLTPSAREVFSVGEDGRLVAHEVSIGDVHGDRIAITTELPGDLLIVTDARGLSEGQRVNLATSTP